MLQRSVFIKDFKAFCSCSCSSSEIAVPLMLGIYWENLICILGFVMTDIIVEILYSDTHGRQKRLVGSKSY